MSKFNRNNLDAFDLLETAYEFMVKARLATSMDRPRKRDPKVYAEGNRLKRGRKRSLWSYMLVFKVVKGQLLAEFYCENSNNTDESYRTGYLQGYALRKALEMQCQYLGLPASLAKQLNNALDTIKG